MPPIELQKVAVFLERTGVNYQELAQILGTRFINPDGLDHPNAVVIADPNNSCDAGSRYLCAVEDLGNSNGASARSLTDKHWDRLQRFIRLWRKLGWSINDVDRALTALGVHNASRFDLRFLRQLGQAALLRDELNLPLTEALSLWANIDTLGNHEEVLHVGSLYAHLFLSRTVRDLAAAHGAFDLNPAAPVPESARRITANSSAIQAALCVTADDLAALREATNLLDRAEGERRTFPMITLENLSALHRFALLARALRMTVRELLDLQTLTGVDPFAAPPTTPGNTSPTQQEGTARLVELARKVQQSGFSSRC